MKCKYCGQEIVIDNQTKVGTCTGCGKKFAISTVVKAKVCKVCNTGLVEKEAYWECPNCGKKYIFSKKKEKDNKEESSLSNDTVDQAEDNYAQKENLSSNIFDMGIVNNENGIETEEKNDDESFILPTAETGEIVKSNRIISEENNVSESEESDDCIIPNKTTFDDITDENFDNDTNSEYNDFLSEVDLSDDEIIDDIADEEVFSESNNDEQILSEEQENYKEDSDKEIYNDFENNENDYTPELYDDNGNSVEMQNSFVRPISSLDNKENQRNKTTSKGANVCFKIFGILFGILAVLAGLCCYIFTHFNLVEKLINVSLGSKLAILQKVCVFAFWGIFAVIMLLATLKKIGLKRIGTIICIISSILIIFTIVFEKKLTESKIFTYAVYAGYAVLLMGSFLTMVINCKDSLSKTANAMGIVLFVFSLIALLVVALQMIPLKALKLDFLESAIQYLKDVDKILLGFASISSAVLIAKSE